MPGFTQEIREFCAPQLSIIVRRVYHARSKNLIDAAGFERREFRCAHAVFFSGGSICNISRDRVTTK
ncbi:hypothetical protein MA13_contig00020-0002 [Edwardsiella piscicida]|nr:hypothetical protein MA13_contig00020-0002 [Edwardsiella piscicida]